MLNTILTILLNVLSGLALLAGLFFMFVGALGVARLPDFFSRNHAASKCATLGILGMLVSLVLHIGVGALLPEDAARGVLGREIAAEVGDRPTTAVATKAILVVAFIFVAVPVGSHMLARAAHLSRSKLWEGTLSDELAEDRHAGDDGFPAFRGRPSYSSPESPPDASGASAKRTPTS